MCYFIANSKNNYLEYNYLKNIIDIYISKIDFYSINELVISVPKIIHWKLLRSFRFPRSIGNINFHSINEFFFFFNFYLDQGPSLIIQKEDFIFQFPITQAYSIPLPVTICFLTLFFNGEILFELIILRPLLHKWKTFDLSARKLIKIFY